MHRRFGGAFRAAVTGLALSGCASVAGSSADPEGGRAASPEPGQDTVSARLDSGDPATTALAPLDFDSLVTVIRSEADRERTPSVLPFGIVWTPTPAEEGSALAVRLLQPRGGREPVDVTGRFADREVRFGRLGDAWLGMAAVPIGTHGPENLEIEARFADGTSTSLTVPLDIATRDWDEASLSVAPRYSSPPPEVQERIARERRIIRRVLDSVSGDWMLDGPFVAPREYDVTSPYGQERIYNGELQSRHTGVDLRGRTGAPVRAAGSGRVVLSGDFYYAGNAVFLDHGLGVLTGYFHLSEILVDEGDWLNQGDLLGRVGMSGRVTGPHLHWSLWIGGTGQDASSLLRMDLPPQPAP